MRSGTVIPMHCDVKSTSKATKATGYSLFAAIDATGEALGKLYLDDGNSNDAPFSDITFHIKIDNRQFRLEVQGTFNFIESAEVHFIELHMPGLSSSAGFSTASTKKLRASISLSKASVVYGEF